MDAIDMSGAVEFVDSVVRRAGGPVCVLAVNPEKAMSLPRDPWLLEFFSNAELLIPDGIGVVWALKALYHVAVERVPGADLMVQLCGLAAERGYSVFLYGASEEASASAADRLAARFPRLRIAGRANGYLPHERAQALADEINASGADILFVALGSPKQEQWIAANRPRLRAKVIQGIGGTLDTLAGTVKRAPAVWQSAGLEWFYRLLEDPRRLRRQRVLPVFAWRVLRRWTRGRA